MNKTLKIYLKRLVWRTPNQRFTFFLQIGVINTLIYGVLFTAFSDTAFVSGLQLFEFTNEYLPSVPGNLWGSLLLFVVLGHCAEMIWRGRGIGSIVAMTGFMLWLYALLAYIVVGSYISILLVTFWPICFWLWYYASAIQYKKELDKGLVKPVD